MKLYTCFQANHGGVKGKLPLDVINQDPTTLSQTTPVKKGRKQEGDDEDGGDSEDETPAVEEEEVLNESNGEDSDEVSDVCPCFISSY